MFVALVFQDHAQVAELLVGGAVVASVELASQPRLNASLVVGASSGAANGFAGTMKDLFVYAAALSAAELRYLMASTVDATPVVAGKAGFAFHVDPQSQYEAQVEIERPQAEQTATGSLLLWLAPDHSQSPATNLSICQFLFASGRMLSVWASFDEASGSYFVHVLDATGAPLTTVGEWVLPQVALRRDATWAHLAITWTAQTMRLYLDAVAKVRDFPFAARCIFHSLSDKF